MTDPDRSIIRVELGDEVAPGVWRYTVCAFALEGRSRQPLLDACRQLKSMGAETASRAGLFRAGRSAPDLTCRIGVGADTAVSETVTRFVPYKPHPMAGSKGDIVPFGTKDAA